MEVGIRYQWLFKTTALEDEIMSIVCVEAGVSSGQEHGLQKEIIGLSLL